MARAENTACYTPAVTIGQVGASLAWGLIKNHAFIDGNKRVGFAALQAFLELNGYALSCSEEQETEAVLAVAANEMTEADWIAWCESFVVAKP